jgi:hypothetical protein
MTSQVSGDQQLLFPAFLMRGQLTDDNYYCQGQEKYLSLHPTFPVLGIFTPDLATSQCYFVNIWSTGYNDCYIP